MGVMAARLRRVNVAGPNRPVCVVALGVADGREWVSILNMSIGTDSSLDGWIIMNNSRDEGLKTLSFPVYDKEQSQNRWFSRSPAIDK